MLSHLFANWKLKFASWPFEAGGGRQVTFALEKDINGNRRENCSLSFKCTLNVLEWEVDPFKKREEDIADDRLRFQQNINTLEAQKREKEIRRQKVQDAKDLIKKKRNAHFQKKS